NQVDKQGNTPLIRAASQKDLSVIKMLAEKTQDINHVNAKGESALTLAVRVSSAQVVGYLLSKGAKPLVDREGKNLAYHLVQSYRAADPDFTAKMDLLEQNGVDFATPQKDGSTLYHVAVGKQEIGLLDSLKKFGIDLNATDKDGMTALHKAAMIAKDDKILKYLMASGANPRIKTEFDETAFDLARENELLAKDKISIDFLK
ncbi:MAG TPA: ankyrin repeat domain-containing protein, partial [Flavobacterium sp.]|nr:ankyrin repeat domain-containing protein [Flavobacterium sp.]